MNIRNALARSGVNVNSDTTSFDNPTTFTDTVTCEVAVTCEDDLTVEGTLNAGTVETTEGVGAVAGTGVTVAEQGDGAVHKTVFTFTNAAVVLADEAGVVAYGGLKIYDFPAGYIRTLGASSNIAVTKTSAGVNTDWDGDFGVGTATASNNATLSSTEQDVIPTTATPQAVAGATTANGVSTASEDTIKDGHSTAKDLYINFLVDDADHNVNGTACNLILNGTLTVIWTNFGDN